MCGLTFRVLPKTWRTSFTALKVLPGAPNSRRLKTCAWMSGKSSVKSCSTKPCNAKRRRMNSSRQKSFAPVRGAGDRSTGKKRRRKNVSWRLEPARPNGRSRKVTAAIVGGLFFPQSRSLGIDQRTSSPTVVEKIVYAGTACRSFADASQVLKKLAHIDADAKQVERLTRALGAERVAERVAEVKEFQKLPLPKK